MRERRKDQDGFDVLGDILETLRFQGSIFFCSDLAAPWGLSLAPTALPRFHVCLSGDCYVGSAGQDAVNVGEMDIVVVPGGTAHWIADRPGRRLIPSTRADEACELGNPLFQRGEITHRVMCGLVHYDQASPHPVLDSLPSILHFSRLEPAGPIWMTVALIDAEISQAQDHRSAIVDRLTEVLFLQLLNHYIDENDDVSGFFAALRDRRVRRALKLIHQEPAFHWTLSSLGDRVGMSRATLVRHFEDAMGVAPMRYVMNWRVTKAYSLIKYTATPLEGIADSVGFASARTLSRAFQRHYHCTPSELRQAERALTTR